MSERKIPSYRKKFGSSKPDYAHRRCSHGHGHIEKVDGYSFDVCDICNVVRKNLGRVPHVHLKREAA